MALAKHEQQRRAAEGEMAVCVAAAQRGARRRVDGDRVHHRPADGYQQHRPEGRAGDLGHVACDVLWFWLNFTDGGEFYYFYVWRF